MKFSKRLSREADREFLWALHQNSMREYVDQTWGWRDADHRTRFNQSSRPGDLEIIEIENVPVGFISTESIPGKLRLLSIEITPSYQRQGIATSLIQDLISKATNADQLVELQVLRVNPARKLYERLGFALRSETKTHFIMEHPAGCSV